ncbi:MAG: hypothetical protein H6737_00545 [Alphaproteobacteria bacterium]|nr:hypothetical protein [Alphaproteobacteria bacterium]
MSDPYDAPTTRTSAVVSDEDFAESLATMVREFRIWHTGLGALFLFFCLLMLLVAGFMALGGLSAGSDAIFMVVMGGFYGILALTYGVPAVLLLRSGIAAMRVFSGVDDRDAILDSIRMQLWLWRLIGVMVMGFTLLYVGLFALAFVFGMAAVL